jgi:hypothetical protein
MTLCAEKGMPGRHSKSHIPSAVENKAVRESEKDPIEIFWTHATLETVLKPPETYVIFGS